MGNFKSSKVRAVANDKAPDIGYVVFTGKWEGVWGRDFSIWSFQKHHALHP
jgi:hypothetical protein